MDPQLIDKIPIASPGEFDAAMTAAFEEAGGSAVLYEGVDGTWWVISVRLNKKIRAGHTPHDG